MRNSDLISGKVRGLNNNFIEDLKEGFLKPITLAVCSDRDLILEIRNNYLNIYYKGQSLLKLSQGKGIRRYYAQIHEKFNQGISGALSTAEQVDKFIEAIPNIKNKISKLFKGGKEIEFEQMIIRANNFEPKLRSDYLIIDRQVIIPGVKVRFDLIGVHLPLTPPWWHKKKVPLALFEIKFGIANLCDQLLSYHKIVSENIERLCREAETILKQKVGLGLFPFEEGKLRELEKIEIPHRPRDVKYIVLLVDYNPNSRRYQPEINRLKELEFVKQLSIFHMGFGLWEAYKMDLECKHQ